MCKRGYVPEHLEPFVAVVSLRGGALHDFERREVRCQGQLHAYHRLIQFRLLVSVGPYREVPDDMGREVDSVGNELQVDDEALHLLPLVLDDVLHTLI